MDKRKLVEHNKKVLETIERENKVRPKKRIERISDEERIILKDYFSYTGKKIAKDQKDAFKKVDDVIRYYKPKWTKPDESKKVKFFISAGKEKKRKVKYDVNKFYRELYGIR
jgi:hypothetical protein